MFATFDRSHSTIGACPSPPGVAWKSSMGVRVVASQVVDRGHGGGGVGGFALDGYLAGPLPQHAPRRLVGEWSAIAAELFIGERPHHASLQDLLEEDVALHDDFPARVAAPRSQRLAEVVGMSLQEAIGMNMEPSSAAARTLDSWRRA